MTERNATVRHDPGELGELEREIMQIVWQAGETSSERVREALARPLKDSTVRTVLRRLEEKGYVKHRVESRAFVYRPAEARQRVAARAVKQIIDRFCGGSVEALLVGMVDTAMLDRKELRSLAEKIAVVKREENK